jgi:hypothetical protein
MPARLPYLNREDLPEQDRELFDRISRERGGAPVGNIFRTLANAPNLFRRFNALGGELRNGTELDPKLRELALMTVWAFDRGGIRVRTPLKHFPPGRHPAPAARASRRLRNLATVRRSGASRDALCGRNNP